MVVANNQRESRVSRRPKRTTVGAIPVLETVEAVETVPSVTEAPLTVSQRRRRGIETPVRRVARLKEEAALAAATPYGAFTPFVTEEGTLDIAKMVKEIGSGKAATVLATAGYTVTPKVVEAIAAGKDVPGMTATDRAVLAKLAGLSSLDVVIYITGGDLGAKETVMADMPPDLKGWYSENLSGVTLAAMVDRLWPTPEPRPGTRVRVRDSGLRGETLAKAEYLIGLGFSPAAVVEFIHGSGFRASEGETGHILTKIAGKTAPEGLSADLKAWYNRQIAEMEAALVAARKEAKAKIAKLKASGKEYDHSDIDRIYYNAYPKWSDQYKSNKQEYARHKAYEVKIAAWKAQQEARIPGAEITEITIKARRRELARVKSDEDSGISCPATIETFKVKLKDGSVVLVQAIDNPAANMNGEDIAKRKAEAAGLDVAWVTKKMTDDKVYQPSSLPSVDLGLFTVENAEGKEIKVHAPLDATDDLIKEIADAYQLRGTVEDFTITGRGKTSVTTDKASQLLSNAQSTSGRLYGLMYMTISPIFGADNVIPSDSTPIRTGPAKTDIGFLTPGNADAIRLTDAYVSAQGDDAQKLAVAYQPYVVASEELDAYFVDPVDIGATPEELAAVAADQESGVGCPSVINTYRIKLRDGSTVLIQAIQSGGNSEAGRNAARAKAEKAGYNVAWVTKVLASDKTGRTEIDLGALIEDKGQEGAVTLLAGVGIEEAAEFVSSYIDMPEQWRKYVDLYGYNALEEKLKICGDTLSDFKQSDGSYDIYGALLSPDKWEDSAKVQNAVTFMFGSNTTSEALAGLSAMRMEVTAPAPPPGVLEKEGARSWFAVVKEFLTPWEESKGQTFVEWFQRPGTMVGDIRRRLTDDEGFKKWYDAQSYPDLVYGYGPMIIPAAGALGGVVGSIGPRLLKGLKWYGRAPTDAAMKALYKLDTIIGASARIPGFAALKIPQLATHLVRLVTLAVPLTYGAAYIAEKVRNTDFQRKWNIFYNLPESKKDEWAVKTGYKSWEGLDEAQQSAVLARYAVPTSYTTTEWTTGLGEYAQKLVELGEKGRDWIMGQQPISPEAGAEGEEAGIEEAGAGAAPAAFVGALGVGTGVGMAEMLMYKAAIPLVLVNILVRIPTGEAWGYTKWVLSGMASFFREVPGTFISGPYGAGRVLGLFVLSPQSVFKMSKSMMASMKPGYIPERGMGIRLNTLRVVFSAKQLGLLSGMNPAELKLLGTRIGATLMRGRNYVKDFGRIKLEVKTVPYQRVVGDSLWHFTPDMTPFMGGKAVPIVGLLYGSPQAAISAGVQSLVKGIKAIKPGLVEVRVPRGYTIKGTPITKLLAGGRAVEIEAPLKGTLNPIPGFTGKGSSSNMFFGEYPIRRFTIQGVDTPVTKLTAAKLLQVRALAAKEALFDVFLGWSGRLEAIRLDLAAAKHLRQTLQNINKSMQSLKRSPKSTVSGDGRIVSQIKFEHPTKGLVNEKTRGLILDRNNRVLFTRDRADPVGVYDAVGGSSNVKEILIPEIGKWNYELPVGKRPIVTWRLAFRSQAFGELNIVIKQTKYLGMYRGKVGEHSVYGTRVFEGRVDTPYFDRVKAWRKYQQPTYKYAEPEIADAFWWDGKSVPKGAVQPWFYDMLAAVAHKYGWDMSKVKVSYASGRFAGDPAFARRVRAGTNTDLGSRARLTMESDYLSGTYGRVLMPNFRDFVLGGGSGITLMSELIKGRRQAVKLTSTKPTNLVKASTYLVDSLRALRSKLEKMSEQAFKEEYGGLGVSRKSLLGRLDTLRLEKALNAYKGSGTKANAGALLSELNRLTDVQTKLVARWIPESNIVSYLDSGAINGRYTAYLNALSAASVAGLDVNRVPVWDGLPRYKYEMMPTADYVLRYAMPERAGESFEYTTPYSVPSYAELRKYPNYAKQAGYQQMIASYVPSKYVSSPVYKAPVYKRPAQIHKPHPVPVGRPVTTPVTVPRPPRPPRPVGGFVRPPPFGLLGVPEEERKRVPSGSIAWAQGALKRGNRMVPQWYYIPPPYDQKDAISLQAPPIGARFTDSVVPRATIQVIGKPESVVPGVVDKDLGWADIKVINGSRIEFKSGGLKTNVGTRIPSATVGVSMEGGGGAVPRGRVVAASSAGTLIPQGSIAWAQGTTGRGISRVQRVRWYYLPPPYTGDPIPLSGPPRGAKNPGSTDPRETLQIVGRSRKAMPSASKDIGWAVVQISGGTIPQVSIESTKLREVETTVVGRPGVPEREPTEQEVSDRVRAAQLDLELGEEPLMEPLPGPKTRVGLPKKKPRRKAISEWDRATTLRGFNPYTLEGL